MDGVGVSHAYCKFLSASWEKIDRRYGKVGIHAKERGSSSGELELIAAPFEGVEATVSVLVL